MVVSVQSIIVAALFFERRISSFQIPIISNNVAVQRKSGTFSQAQSTFSSRRTFQLCMSTNISETSTSDDNKNKKGKQNSKRRKSRGNKSKTKPLKNPSAIQTWRIFGVEVDPDALGESSLILRKGSKDATQSGVGQIYLSQPVLDALLERLKIVDGNASFTDDDDDKLLTLPPQLSAVRMVRRSLDARKKKVLREGPRYTYVLDIDLTAQMAKELKLKNQPGRNEIVTADMEHSTPEISHQSAESNDQSEKKKVVVVGAGPAGLFCALALAQSGQVTPILLERGQAVESRGKDIGALIHRSNMNSESNFAFGEGGAGTWSDGKLTTRIGRNSKNVRSVLETFVKYGAPEKILVDGAPHLGTDNLVKLLRNMRKELRALGGQVIFGAKMTKIISDEKDTGRVTGVEVKYSASLEKGVDLSGTEIKKNGSTEIINGDAVVLATGHSARDVYEDLHRSGVKLEPKGFAAGFRVEHPQKIINKIQYGGIWGRNAYSGKSSTDEINHEYFASDDTEGEIHNGRLPVSSYRLATDKAFDGESERGAYSFCMCPGGQIVSYFVFCFFLPAKFG